VIVLIILTDGSKHKDAFEYRISIKSGRDSYYRALDMIKEMNIALKRFKPDKYHLGQNVLRDFNEA